MLEIAMSVLNQIERQALNALRKGGLIEQEAAELLIKKKLVNAHPLELTEAGRIVCQLLQEIETLQGSDDSGTRSESY
jgi:hypothetical protein